MLNIDQNRGNLNNFLGTKWTEINIVSLERCFLFIFEMFSNVRCSLWNSKSTNINHPDVILFLCFYFMRLILLKFVLRQYVASHDDNELWERASTDQSDLF